MKSKKVFSAVIFSVLLVLCISVMFASAHGGKTDSRGGHRDKNNVSGLGSYHYHCGGYPAHLHPNGVCPYASDKSSSYNTTSRATKNSINSNDNLEKKTMDSNDIFHVVLWSTIATVIIAAIAHAIVRSLCDKIDKYNEYTEKCKDLDCKLKSADEEIFKYKELNTDLEKKNVEVENQKLELSWQIRKFNHDVQVATDKRINEIAKKVMKKPFFRDSEIGKMFYSEDQPLDFQKINDIIYADMELNNPIDIQTIVSSNGNEYTVTLDSCTCPDFAYRKKPCKHMIRLAYELGVLFGCVNFDELEKRLSHLECLQEQKEQDNIKNKHKKNKRKKNKH